MEYIIANEIVEVNIGCNKNVKRFENYKNHSACSEKDNDDKIVIDVCGLDEFKKNSDLSSEQSELIYSLQLFFCGMLRKEKILVHASVVAKGNNCVLFVGKPEVGKSYLATKMREAIDGAYILSDDRSVIGLSNGVLCAWNTPWSKNGVVNADGVPVRSICHIESGSDFKMKKISVEELIVKIIHDYPNEYKNALLDLFNQLVSETCSYSIINDKRSFDEKKMRSISNVL